MRFGSTACALFLIACGSDPGPRDAAAPADAAAGEDGGAPVSTEPTLPEVTGACPTFEGDTITVAPEGVSPRDARLWISDASADLDGPLVFYWHGTGSAPAEAEYGLGAETIEAILALGGMVVAPEASGEAGTFPWFLTTGSRDDDLRVADEVLACAIERVGVDTTHVHSIGMSAGGLHTTQMGFRRASYVASVVTYSGGIYVGRPRTDDPNNRFAALIFHGGPDDVVVIEFQDASEEYFRYLRDRGHFAAICDHGLGHRIPTDARESVWRFFSKHPYGSVPSPWADGLPEGFYAPCELAIDG